MHKYTMNDWVNLIAVVSIALALFACIYLDYKDLAFATAGTLGGVIGMATKEKFTGKELKSND